MFNIYYLEYHITFNIYYLEFTCIGLLNAKKGKYPAAHALMYIKYINVNVLLH